MAVKKSRTTFSSYFWFNQWMLECSGVLPLPGRVLPGMYMIAVDGDNIDSAEKVNIIAGESLEIWVSAIKVMVLLPHRATVLSIFRRASQLWSYIKDDKDLSIVKPCARRGLYLTYGFSSTVYLALLSVLVAPVFMVDVYDANGTMIASKSLPYTVGMLHENKLLFKFWWALQVPAGFLAATCVLSIDTATAVFVLHACGHLRLLQSKFRSIEDQITRKHQNQNFKAIEYDREIVEKEYRVAVTECISIHQEIICFCEEIEQVFKYVVLIQMMLSISAICGFGFNLLAQEHDRVKYFVHLVGAAIQLLIFCWPPDSLQDESMNIGFEAFNLKWYNFLKRDQSVIEFIITRSQKPLLLTAGKFSNMSLMTFSSILSSAFSYFSILRKTL